MNVFDNVIRIAFLGSGGSYTEIAKDLFLEKYSLNLAEEPLHTIRETINFVDENPLTLGVIPIENSVEGTVRETIDCLSNTKNDIKILGEVIVPIKNCLLSRTTELYSISGVIAHPQAFAQCQTFIKENLPMNLNVINANSTAEAARALEGYNLTYSAIGSEKTAKLYNLNILCENINDEPNNMSRFILIGNYQMPKTGNDKTSFVFSVGDKSGALLDVLEVLHKYNINMSHIDSRPSKMKFGDYTFFVDISGYSADENITSAINEIQDKTTYFKLIGSYEKAVLSE